MVRAKMMVTSGRMALLCLFVLGTTPVVTGQESGQSKEKQSASGRGIAQATKADDAKKLVLPDPRDGWKPLLPKMGLTGWEKSDFGTEAEVRRENELLVLEMGDPLNGITYLGKDFPTTDFEIYLEAKRLEGSDFLCGLTFPVGEEFCSFIAGGWGGGLVGLSSVDGMDASENATTTYHDFENDKWYKFHVRVDQEFVRAWIDEKEFFRQEREDHEFSTRIEVYSSQPLGLCAFQSKVVVRNFAWRPIKQPKVKSASPSVGSATPVIE